LHAAACFVVAGAQVAFEVALFSLFTTPAEAGAGKRGRDTFEGRPQ